jgi:hypothetical protein
MASSDLAVPGYIIAIITVNECTSLPEIILIPFFNPTIETFFF